MLPSLSIPSLRAAYRAGSLTPRDRNLCESAVPEGSREITALGGWRAFLAEGSA
jgi:hypothetical protein